MQAKGVLTEEELLSLYYYQDNPAFVKKIKAIDSPSWTSPTHLFFIQQRPPLYFACLENKKNIVKALLEAGADPNAPYYYKNESPLIVACKMGHYEIVALLLKHGAKAQAENREGHSPLLAACAANDIRIINCLIQNGAQVNLPDERGQTPLFKALDHVPAVAVKTIKNLLAAGADINHRDKKDRTVLHIIFSKLDLGGKDHKGYLNILKQLLHAGADILSPISPNMPFSFYDLALEKEPSVTAVIHEYLAIHINNKFPYNLIETEAQIKALMIKHQEHSLGLTASFLVAMSIAPKHAKEMLQHIKLTDLQLKHPWHQLLLACLQEDIPAVERLLKSEELDKDDKLEVSPLDLAFFAGNDQLISILLAHTDAKINQCSKHLSPLLLASRYGHFALVEARLAIDDINATDKKGFTALDWACKNGHNAIAILLLQDKNLLLNKTDYRVLINTIASSGNIALLNELKKSLGYNEVITDEKTIPPLLYAAVMGQMDMVLDELRKGADVNCSDLRGRTALYLACDAGNIALVKTLLEAGADGLMSSQGKTPLSIACELGNLALMKIFFAYPKYKENQNLLDSLLLIACEFGHLEIALWLIKHDAHVNVTDNSGNTPLHKATEEGHIDIARLLLSYGARFNIENVRGRTASGLAHDGNVIIFNMCQLMRNGCYNRNNWNQADNEIIQQSKAISFWSEEKKSTDKPEIKAEESEESEQSEGICLVM